MSASPTPGALGAVLIAGATGLVGREAVKACLLDEGVTEVRALVRRPLTLDAVLGPLAFEAPVLTPTQRERFRPVQVDFQRQPLFVIE